MSAAIRLIFAVADGKVTLVSRQPVDMTLPASQLIEDDAPHPEFVAEVRTADERPLHRAAMPNPLEPHREAFSDEPDRSIHRVAVDRPQGVFTMVVPDHPEADHVSLLLAGPAHESLGLAAGTAEAPREIARVPLHGPDEAPRP
jgi:hypothetical protein